MKDKKLTRISLKQIADIEFPNGVAFTPFKTLEGYEGSNNYKLLGKSADAQLAHSQKEVDALIREERRAIGELVDDYCESVRQFNISVIKGEAKISTTAEYGQKLEELFKRLTSIVEALKQGTLPEGMVK